MPVVMTEKWPNNRVGVDQYDHGLYLPLHPYLQDDDVWYICQALTMALTADWAEAPIECSRNAGWVKDARRQSFGAFFTDL